MDNGIKQYRYKLLHRIIATNENLFTWKLSYVFKSCGVSKQVRSLQYLVIGYKSELLEYNLINFLFSYIGFAIYESYFCCERRKKQFNILNILIEELKVLETYCHTKNFKCNMMTIFMNKLCR